MFKNGNVSYTTNASLLDNDGDGRYIYNNKSTLRFKSENQSAPNSVRLSFIVFLYLERCYLLRSKLGVWTLLAPEMLQHQHSKQKNFEQFVLHHAVAEAFYDF